MGGYLQPSLKCKFLSILHSTALTMPAGNRVHEIEFAIIRRHFMDVGTNWQLVVLRTRREIATAEFPHAVKQLWAGNSEQQLRRRVRNAVQDRIQK